MADPALVPVSLADMAARTGEEIGVSGWVTVDQPMIDAFAALTGDHQFIHVDPARTRAETPLDGTIAHGFLTLSLLAAMKQEAMPPLAGTARGMNYGFDRIRFLTPVPSGARIRGRFKLLSVDERKPGEVTMTVEASVEIEGQTRPALSAVWLSRRYLA